MHGFASCASRCADPRASPVAHVLPRPFRCKPLKQEGRPPRPRGRFRSTPAEMSLQAKSELDLLDDVELLLDAGTPSGASGTSTAGPIDSGRYTRTPPLPARPLVVKGEVVNEEGRLGSGQDEAAENELFRSVVQGGGDGGASSSSAQLPQAAQSSGAEALAYCALCGSSAGDEDLATDPGSKSLTPFQRRRSRTSEEYLSCDHCENMLRYQGDTKSVGAMKKLFSTDKEKQ